MTKSAKLGVLTGMIAFSSFGFFLFQAFGGSVINITLTSNPDLERGLIGHWTFDGKDIDLSSVTAEIIDRSTNSNNLNWGDHATTTIQGVIGQAISFDNADDYVGVTDPGDGSLDVGTSDFSVCLWHKSDAIGELDVFAGKRIGSGLGWIVYRLAGGNLGFRIDDGTLVTVTSNGATSISDGKWHHICYIADRSDVAQFYVDTMDNGTGDISARTGTLSNSTSFCIASINDCISSGGSFASGGIDDVRVYNRTLSFEEVTRLYGLGATTKINTTIKTNLGLESGLVGHWTFDGKDMISNIADISGNGEDAIIIGQTSTTSTTGVSGQALSFDGVNDAAQTDSTINSGSDIITLTYWLKWDNFADDNVLLFELSTNFNSNNGTFSNAPNSSSCSKYAVAIQDNGYRQECFDRAGEDEWHHYSIIYDNSTTAGDISVYFDGVEISTTIGVNSKTTSSNFKVDTLYIMSRAASSLFGAGDLDEVRLYNRALSAAEISRLYGLGATTHLNKTLTTNPDLESGLVVHYTFDGKDMINNVADVSGNGNHGSFIAGVVGGSTTTSPGVIGQAIMFADDIADGDNINGGSAASLDGLTTLSISVWVKLPKHESVGFSAIVTKGNWGYNKGWALETCGTADAGCMFGGQSYRFWYAFDGISDGIWTTPDSSVILDTWQHVVVTYDTGSTLATMYIDGESVSVTTQSTPNGSPDLDDVMSLCIDEYTTTTGSALCHSGRGHEGALYDDVRVYNRILSVDEVSRLYDLGK